MMLMSVRRLCTNALLLASALIIAYLESLLPLALVVPVPGVKLGLANIAVMVAFFGTGEWDAAVVSFLRVALGALLFGSVMSLWFSLAGALLAYFGLIICRRFLSRRVSMIGTSVLSAALHCIGQIAACAVLLGDKTIFYYLGVMLAVSVFTGIVNGAAASRLLALLPKNVHALRKDAV